MMVEMFRLSSENSDLFRQFVTDTAMKSWRNGRATGWRHAVEEIQDANAVIFDGLSSVQLRGVINSALDCLQDKAFENGRHEANNL